MSHLVKLTPSIFLILYIFIVLSSFCLKITLSQATEQNSKKNEIFGDKMIELISNLVSNSFLKTSSDSRNGLENSENLNNNLSTPGVFFQILRLFGMNSSKILAMTLNGLVFIAQMVGKFMNPPNSNQNIDTNDFEVPNNGRDARHESTRYAREGSPVDWMLSDHPKELSSILPYIRDTKLVDHLVEALNVTQNSKVDGECSKLLLCKIVPFVWHMQQSISNRINWKTNVLEENPTNSIILPTREEYIQHEHFCQLRYTLCNTNEIKVN